MAVYLSFRKRRKVDSRVVETEVKNRMILSPLASLLDLEPIL